MPTTTSVQKHCIWTSACYCVGYHVCHVFILHHHLSQGFSSDPALHGLTRKGHTLPAEKTLRWTGDLFRTKFWIAADHEIRRNEGQTV
ncbi:hypothetical protein MHYP_G00135250 [Metynnis hypsauchen]